MISAISSTLSALRAFGIRMGVTANNVANVQSDGFKKSRSILKEGPNGGVSVEISRVEAPGPILVEKRDGETIQTEISNVDLGEEIPQATLSRRYYEANLKYLQTEDEMSGTILDIIK